jgi:hypothetical protein
MVIPNITRRVQTRKYAMNQDDVSHSLPQNLENHEFDFQKLHEEQRAHEHEAASLEESPGDSTQRYKQFISEIAALQDPEAKLTSCIAFMEEAIAQAGSPHFKEFWEARKMCLDLFKENINPSVRMAIWAKYSELCRQARSLKELLNEQSAFACEQLEMAVAALEKEIEAIPEWIQRIETADIGSPFMSIEDTFSRYTELQKELSLLNAYASRTNTLRKELIKTQMRIRQKNKFFERLSSLGDKIFPRRKELIQEVSVLFVQDVEKFIQSTFVSEMKTVALFDVREEIKALQSFAKVLTLNTEAFSKTRKGLSECWDSIKQVIKERRKVSAEQKTAFKQHRDEFMKELEAIQADIPAEQAALVAAEKRVDDLVFKMRKTPLGKGEIKELRDMVHKVRELLFEKSQHADAQKRQQVQKKEQEELECFSKMRKAFEELLQSEAFVEEIQNRSQTLAEEAAQCVFTKSHKQQIEKFQRQVEDYIEDKKDSALMQLSQEDQASLAKLKSVLKDLMARKQ